LQERREPIMIDLERRTAERTIPDGNGPQPAESPLARVATGRTNNKDRDGFIGHLSSTPKAVPRRDARYLSAPHLYIKGMSGYFIGISRGKSTALPYPLLGTCPGGLGACSG